MNNETGKSKYTPEYILEHLIRSQKFGEDDVEQSVKKALADLARPGSRNTCDDQDLMSALSGAAWGYPISADAEEDMRSIGLSALLDLVTEHSFYIAGIQMYSSDANWKPIAYCVQELIKRLDGYDMVFVTASKWEHEYVALSTLGAYIIACVSPEKYLYVIDAAALARLKVDW